jgi:hypothetical protein
MEDALPAGRILFSQRFGNIRSRLPRPLLVGGLLVLVGLLISMMVGEPAAKSITTGMEEALAPVVRSAPRTPQLDNSEDREFPEAPHDPFRTISFAPPAPPPAAAPAPPPVPVVRSAPALPYTYFGRMTGPDGAELVYLMRENRVTPVQVGQVIDTDYRIDAITATRVVVTYLPLDEKVTLVTAATE